MEWWCGRAHRASQKLQSTCRLATSADSVSTDLEYLGLEKKQPESSSNTVVLPDRLERPFPLEPLGSRWLEVLRVASIPYVLHPRADLNQNRDRALVWNGSLKRFEVKDVSRRDGNAEHDG